MMRQAAFCLFLSLVVLFAAGCAGEEMQENSPQDTIKIVTTIYPLADIIRELGGDQISVAYLLPAGASPHTYEPTVEQARAVSEAHLFVCIGAGLDDWAVKLTEASSSGLPVINLADNLNLLDSTHYYDLVPDHEDDHHSHDEDGHEHQGDDHDHHHGPVDPHFWLDPLIIRDYISPFLANELSSLLPESQDIFAERLTIYSTELTVLHEEITEAVATFTYSNFISFHSAWQYFGQRYGLQELAVIAEFPGQEPSAGWIAELLELISDENIQAIFAEPQFSPALAERVAEECGIMVLVIDPLGGENLHNRDSYLKLMRYNLNAFKEALQ